MKSCIIAISVAAVSLIAVACGKSGDSMTSRNVIKSVAVANLNATLANDSGVLKHGDQELMLSFTDASGKPVDVGAIALIFHMPQMGSMAEMNEAVTLTTTSTPGVYRGRVNIEVPGEWQAKLACEGPVGKGTTTFSVTAQ